MQGTESINTKSEHIKKELLELFIINKNLSFYKVMKYPVPTNYKTFTVGFVKRGEDKKISNKFSRNKKNSQIEDYMNYINKFGTLYRSIPFIKAIYLCNSITFNKLNDNSDIDVFIITKKKSLRRARFFSVLFFSLLGLKRSIKNKRMKFCLSFYVTENSQNLYSISESSLDVYLNYWIKHLVPLYYEDKDNPNNIYKYNTRLENTFPNNRFSHNINIGNKLFYGKTTIKKVSEFLFGGILGRIIEIIIKTLWLPLVITKINRNKQKNRGVIINNNMLKFYDDKRREINLLYRINNR